MRILAISISFGLTVLSFAGTVKARVDGEGYIRLAKDGQVVFASQAEFTVRDHRLVEVGGAEPLPQIRADGENISIALDGTISVNGCAAGRLVIGLFPKGASLQRIGTYWITDSRAKLANPGEGTCGVIRSDTAPKPNGQAPKPVKNPTSIGRPTIVVMPESKIKGDAFTLGDIAEVQASADVLDSLRAVEIGRTPAIGVVRGIDAVGINARLRMAGYKPEQFSISVPLGAKVLRSSQSISSDQLVAAASEAVRMRFGLNAPLKLNNIAAPVLAPEGQVAISVGSLTKNNDGFSASVQVSVDGKPVQTRFLQLTVAGGIVNVPANTPIKIRVRVSGASLEVGGKTKTAGFVGQMISVQTDTGSVHQGMLIDQQTVEVKL